MKSKIIFLLLILNSVLLPAQIRIDWQQCYGSMGRDEARGIIEKKDGYWVAGAVMEQNGMVTCDISSSTWLIGIAYEGTMEREYCVDSLVFSDLGGIFKGSGDDFISIGWALNNNNLKQLNITSFNSDAEIVWSKNFGDKNRPFWTFPHGAITLDGGVIANITTQWSGGDISNYYGSYDVWVVKVDSLGNLEWETTIGTNDFEYQGAITLASDGGYYVSMCGRPGNNGSITACTPQTTDMYDGLLVKLDGNGQVLWNRCYAGSEDDQIYQALELDDGLLLLCDTQSDDRDAEGAGYHLGYPHGDEFYGKTCDIWLLKTDFDGNILWSKCYGGTGHEFPLKVFQNEDGGFTVFGTTQSLDGDVASTSNMHPHQPEVGQKIWVFRIDAGAINIKLKKAITMTGRGEVGSGFIDPWLWNVKLTPMFFSKTTQWVANYKTNNIGDQVENEGNILSFGNAWEGRRCCSNEKKFRDSI